MRKHVVFAGFCLLILLSASQAWADDDRLVKENAFIGKPSIEEGDALGYFVWKTGDTWHVRWTTFGGLRRFTGRVTALGGGDIDSLKRIDVETERRVIRPGRAPHVVRGPRGRAHVVGGRPPVVAQTEQDRIEKENHNNIVFRSMTDDDLDGFDFKIDDKVDRVRLLLEIDGESKASFVKIGPYKSSVETNPLVIQVR
jgi:hypothetical protein